MILFSVVMLSSTLTKLLKKILNKIVMHLVAGGYFFQGHSESIQGISLPLKQVLPCIY